MKILCFWVALVLPVFCGEEVRCYEVRVGLLERVGMVNRYAEGGDPDPFAADEGTWDDDYVSGVDWLGPVVTGAGFESRFLEGVGELRDCSNRVAGILGMKEFAGRAVYDVEGGRLILKGELGLHRGLRLEIGREMPYQVMTTLSVYELPGVSLEDRSGFWDEVPEGAKLLRAVSWLSLSGQTAKVRGGDGGMVVESEMQMDAYDGYVETRLSLVVDLLEGGFSWATGLTMVAGVDWAQEVGSLDGERTLMLVRRHDFVTISGKPRDEWILKEDGGVFLGEERLEMIRWDDPKAKVELDETREVQRFTVPPTFETFLSTDQNLVDPFGSDGGRVVEPELEKIEGGLVSVRKLMMENGISFREGDFVYLNRTKSQLIAKLCPVNLELLDGIVDAKLGQGPPQEWYLEFAEVEGDDFRKGKVLRKMRIVMLPGQLATMTLGDDLAFEAEMYCEHDETIALRTTLTEQGGDLEKPSFRTEVTLRMGRAVKVQETVIDGKRRSWVATARVKTFEVEVDGLLKMREAGR